MSIMTERKWDSGKKYMSAPIAENSFVRHTQPNQAAPANHRLAVRFTVLFLFTVSFALQRRFPAVAEALSLASCATCKHLRS